MYQGPHSTSRSGLPDRFGLPIYRFRSPLLTASRLISFPPLTKMLQFSGLPLANASRDRSHEDVPFGHPRIKDSLRLPLDFRGLARPSSALEPSHPPGSLAAVLRVGSGYLRGSRMHQRHRTAHRGGYPGRPTPSASRLRSRLLSRLTVML